MEEVVKKWWLTMSEHRLRTHLLVKMRLPSSIAEGLVAKTVALKAEHRKAAIRNGHSRPMWEEFFEAPRHEAGIIRVLKAQLKKQGGEDSARWYALTAYNDVIHSVIAKIKSEVKARGATPSKLPALLHDEGYSLPRNTGEHWTDYVKRSDLVRIRGLFNSLPPPTRGKHKTPFERTMPPKTYAKRKRLVSERLESELASAERELSVVEDPIASKKLSDQIDKMYEAQYLLDKHKRNTPLPITWHGLLK